MSDFSSAFAKTPIIGILRGIDKDCVVPVVNAGFDAGLACIEITLNTPGALELIALAARELRPGTFIGAGTVLSAQACSAAIDAGAQFIVAPNTDREVITMCKSSAIPVFPGALTPTEVYAAWTAGATMVKVFPVSALGGPSYIKDLRGPFDSVKLLACGGVHLGNIGDFFRAGANAIAIGASVFKRQWITDHDFAAIASLVRDYVAAVHEAAPPV